MASNTFVVKARIDGDANSATRAIKSATGALETLGRAAAGVAGFETLRRGLTFALTEAAAAEDATLRLQAALSRLGPTADSVAASLARQAASLSSSTRFADDAVTAAQTRLASIASSRADIESLTAAAADFAAATGTDLESAANKLANSITGSGNALKAYGIEVEGAAKSSERMASVIDGVANRFGGAAVASVESLGGAIERLKNQIDEVAESFGSGVSESTGLTDSLNRIADAFERINSTGDSRRLGQVVSAVLEPIRTIAEPTVIGLGVIASGLSKLTGSILALPLQGIVKLQELFGTAGASASALDATAERLGISIDDLKIRIENAAQATRALNQGTAGAKQSLEELDSVAESAFEGIAKTLGTKFAFQVREEIAKVEDQLAKIGPTAQVGFAEAQAKAEQLRAKLQELRAEEERLRLGLPELGPVARESLGVAIESATELAQGLEAARVGTANVTSGFAALGSQAAASATQVAALAAQVQATALRSGGAAAVSGLSQAQIDSLRVAGVLSNSGRVGSPLTSGRVRLPGGGSRLVSSFGVSSGVFGRSLIGRSSVSSDGRITSLAALDGI